MAFDHKGMTSLTAGLASKSDKIRTLAKAGCERAEIARFLGIRYQHVRKVLVDEEARHAKKMPPASRTNGVVDALSARVRIGPEGRVVIPAPFREALGIKEGDALFAHLEGAEIKLLTAGAAVKRVQAMFAPYRNRGGGEVDTFLSERRKVWGEEDDNA